MIDNNSVENKETEENKGELKEEEEIKESLGEQNINFVLYGKS